MIENYITGIISFAIAFIGLIICMYSYLFLTKTVKHKERKPWEFLFVASVLFVTFQVLSLLTYLGIINAFIDMSFWSKIFEFLYSGFVLLAIISQHDLILNSHLILISKKDQEKDKKET